MERISIIFAYRNREISRIKSSMESLKSQKNRAFEVIFVNYGSEPEISGNLEELLSNYCFVKYYYLEVKQQLWNKSRALNFGIKKAKEAFVFIADVDILFSPYALGFLAELTSRDTFSLFKMGYLGERESVKLSSDYNFKELIPVRYGEVNGMILAAKESFFNVNGYDEFFHFYGSEDVDLYSRLENSGIRSNLVTDVYFLHNWHMSYHKGNDDKLSLNPRLSNALRINQQHYFYNQKEQNIVPNRQHAWGEVFPESEIESLNRPTKKIEIENILAQIEHVFYEELPNIKEEIVEVEVVEAPYSNSIKYKAKMFLNKESQTYCSLKVVNDIILSLIVFYYRDFNYSYKISNDFKSIIFKIQL